MKAVDSGSFTSAGAALGIMSQMVGKHLGHLEERLGAQLLYRTTRQQSLTDVGREFYKRCKRILEEAQLAETVVHELSVTPRGKLRINAPVTFGSVVLVPLVASYLQANPNVEVDLALTDRYIDIVEEGYDVVFRPGSMKDSTLVARVLTPYQLIACASSAYLAEHGSPIVPEDLATHQCLCFVYSSGLSMSKWRFERDGNVYDIEVHGRFQLNDARALRDAAIAGQGIILQADLILKDDLESGRLVQILPNYQALRRPLHIVYSANRTLTTTLRSFIDFTIGALKPANRNSPTAPAS